MAGKLEWPILKHIYVYMLRKINEINVSFCLVFLCQQNHTMLYLAVVYRYPDVCTENICLCKGHSRAPLCPIVVCSAVFKCWRNARVISKFETVSSTYIYWYSQCLNKKNMHTYIIVNAIKSLVLTIRSRECSCLMYLTHWGRHKMAATLQTTL